MGYTFKVFVTKYEEEARGLYIAAVVVSGLAGCIIDRHRVKDKQV